MTRIKEFLAADKHFSVVLVLTIVTVGVLIGILGGAFLSRSNLQSMAVQVSEFGLLALAMGLAMLLGGIELSVVSGAILAGIVGAKFLSGDIIPITEQNSGTVMLIAMGAMVVTGALCGTLNGLLISKLSIPPILTTLSTLIFFSGISMVITNGNSVPNTIPAFAEIGITTVAQVPLIFIAMVAVYLVVGWILARTGLGRRIYLYGENSVALRFAGARHERTVLITFVVIGIIVGLAGMIMVSRVNTARVGFGESYLLQAILVVVLAGFDPYGGRGRVSSLFLGLVLLQSLQSAFTIMRLNPYMKTFIWGFALLVIMVLNDVIDRRTNGKYGFSLFRKKEVDEILTVAEFDSVAAAEAEEEEHDSTEVTRQ